MSYAMKFLKSPFSVALLVMIVYVAFAFYSDVGKLSKTVFKIDYHTIPIILAPMTIAMLSHGFRFHRFLGALDIDIPLKSSIFIYLAGLSLNVTPANSGQIIKSQIIKKQFGIPISKTSPIILVEKWNELNATLIILVILAAINSFLESTLIILIGIGVAVFLFGVMKNSAFFNLFKRVIVRFPRLKIFEESIENSQDALKRLASTKMVLEAIILTMPGVILQALSVYLAFQALGVRIDFIASTQIFYISLIAGVLSLIPGGFGVTEGSMLGLLIRYNNYNNALTLLTAAVIFVRLVTLWYPTFLGLIITRFIVKYK
jgi:glycosyltransferase 2 family protein